jgi:hypothetical protein
LIGELMNEVERDELAELDELARGCDGARLREHLGARSQAQLGQLVTAEPASIRLLAIWEHDRSFAEDGALSRSSIDRLSVALEASLGQAPPTWWIDQLASAKSRADDESGPPSYDVGLGEHADRRGAWQPGPGSTRVRSDAALLLSENAGQLGYDLSIGRVVLGPLPSEPVTMLEHARAQAGTTIYYASFSQASGGFRFPLRAIGSDGRLLWTAEVCGPNRQILGGLGHLTVEIVVLGSGTGVAVFTAESHGVALDVFDPQTGTRTLAWSSDFWFAR